MEIIDKTKKYMQETGARFGRNATTFMRTAPVVVLIACAILMIVSVICCINIVRSRPERNVASVWGQGSGVPYRHVAVYGHGGRAGEMTPAVYSDRGTSLSKTDIYNIRKSLQGIVDTSRGVRRKVSDKPIDPEGWEDAFCSFVKADMQCDHDSFNVSSDAFVYAVSGNFKVFHPYEYMSGGFLPVESVDKYQIVLNDNLAWKFFSSYDIIGERITMWDHEFTIIGVVREHDDNAMRAYVYYDCLEEYCVKTDENAQPAVLCYEALLPEQISGSSVIDLRNTIPGYDMSSPSFYVVSITDRFGLSKVWDHMMPAGEMSAFLQGYELPFWEVSAQKAYSDMFVWMIVFVFSAIVAVITAIVKGSVKGS